MQYILLVLIPGFLKYAQFKIFFSENEAVSLSLLLFFLCPRTIFVRCPVGLGNLQVQHFLC